MSMKLYTYFRSSAAYRVRIALNLKGIAYDSIPVHLLQDGGQQLLPAYRAVNPSALVPALDDDGAILTQSLAMLEYLDETRPAVPLLPAISSAREAPYSAGVAPGSMIQHGTDARYDRKRPFASNRARNEEPSNHSPRRGTMPPPI